mmetsp:Transcript_8690/g.13761  ORF Transcript_8690/g.13761 Transcript_8690/m.13761 type:complete len:284 (-) Transcript_8690:296-1147(-)
MVDLAARSLVFQDVGSWLAPEKKREPPKDFSQTEPHQHLSGKVETLSARKIFMAEDFAPHLNQQRWETEKAKTLAYNTHHTAPIQVFQRHSEGSRAEGPRTSGSRQLPIAPGSAPPGSIRFSDAVTASDLETTLQPANIMTPRETANTNSPPAKGTPELIPFSVPDAESGDFVDLEEEILQSGQPLSRKQQQLNQGAKESSPPPPQLPRRHVLGVREPGGLGIEGSRVVGGGGQGGVDGSGVAEVMGLGVDGPGSLGSEERRVAIMDTMSFIRDAGYEVEWTV